MDPINIQMVIGSPQALRTRTSLPALISRNKKPSHGNKSSAKRRRSQLTKIDEDSQSPSPSQPQSPSMDSDTVRTRRGYRPLSVFTNSILVPFEPEALKAMGEIGNIEDGAAGDLVDSFSNQTLEEGALSAAGSLPRHSASARVPPASSDSEMSIRAFLAQSSPPSATRVIKAPFPMLQDIPAPDISQHPMFADDPFASQSDAPSLVTTSSASEIKNYTTQTLSNSPYQTDRTSTGSSDIFGDFEKNKFVLRRQQASPSTPSKPKISLTAESSPVLRVHPRSCPIEIPYASPFTPNSELEKKRSGSAGIRKLSDMFKSRSNSSQSSETSPAYMLDPPQRTLQELERYLRITEVRPTFEHSPASWQPPHPVTGRGWRSRNLKCTNCLDVSCGVCGITCCAYKAQVMALEHSRRGSQNRADSVEAVHNITAVFPYGRELPTFLRCTKDVIEGRGCGKLVCPECCGVCPNEICGDIQCRRCKKDPWSECVWHADLGDDQPTPATAANDTSALRTV